MSDIAGNRIMHIASGDLWAGAEAMVCQLALGFLTVENVDLVIVVMNKGKLAEELARIGVTVQLVDESRHSFPQCIRTIRTLIKEYAPDVIHSHRYKENILAWCASRGISGSKLVATQHGLPESVGRISIKQRVRAYIFFRLLSIGFKRTVFVSEEMHRSLVGRYGFSKENTVVVHNGITVPKLVICRPKGRVVVGSAGRLFPVKDFSLLVDIARLVVHQNNDIDFVLAGEGPDRTILEEKVNKHGLASRFRFLGQQDDMDAFYNGLDLYINTSVHEGIPMSVIEAMSYGLPVVAPNVGGFPEIIENRLNGFLVENRDPAMFARCILQLFDDKLRSAMGQASREKVIVSFSREAMTLSYYELYSELIGRV